MPTDDQWNRVSELFLAALELDAARRVEFLREQCGDDTELLNEVNSLLAAHQGAGTLFEAIPTITQAFEALHEAEEPLQAGEILGDYQIVRLIARGGMGAVYLATRADEVFEKHVAVKIMKRGMDTAEVLRHFRNERQILARFDHPNIARLLDGGQTESGVPYFVMEYVEGLPFDEYCNQKRLTILQRLHLFRDVCAAVSYAHRHLVIHRDIKPSNIVVTSEGAPKLLDFGIAKILDSDQALSTATGVRLMTPEYASPEQIMGLPITTITDVYSLGVVLYELLTGRSPYPHATGSPLEVARMIYETEPMLPSATVVRTADSDSTKAADISAQRGSTTQELKRNLRGDLDNILLMALRKEVQRRYQSVEQFSEDIQKYIDGRPVLARKDTMVYRITKFAKRNRIAVVAAILVMLSLVAGVAATTWQAQRARAEQARAEYAREFGDETRYLETLLLSTYTAPLHDARPTLALARNRLKRMQKRTEESGAFAFGPGYNALGNGYLMLKEYETAKSHLENAWQSGYREPSTAYALGKVLGILYQKALSAADLFSDGEIKTQAIRDAESRYARPAIEYLVHAKSNAESPAYVEGLIALYEKRYDTALQKSRDALPLSSRPYEVVKLEADVYFEMGRQASSRAEGLKLFPRAGQAYARASEMARSDPDIYLANALRLVRTISASQVEANAEVQDALELCDKAMQINPDNDEPLLLRSQVYLQQGINQMYIAGNDPIGAFNKSIQASEDALLRKPRSETHSRIAEAYLRIIEYQSAITADPRGNIQKAIAASSRALELKPDNKEAHLIIAGANFFLSEYQVAHGEDPSPALQKIINIYATDLKSVNDPYSFYLLGFAHLGKAEYKIKRGSDPREDLAKSVSTFQEALKASPEAANAHANIGLASLDLAKYHAQTGVAPEQAFEDSLREFDRANKIQPDVAFTIFNVGLVYSARAEFKLRTRKDPLSDIDLAEKQFRKSLELSPDLRPAFLQLGALQYMRARHRFESGEDPAQELANAERLLQEYEKYDEKPPEAPLVSARVELLKGRWAWKKQRSPEILFDRAAAEVEKSIQINPNEASAYLEHAAINRWRAAWLMESKKPAMYWIEDALQRTSQAEKVFPNHPEALALRATLLILKSRETGEAALASQGNDLLQQAFQLNRFLEPEYGRGGSRIED